MSPETHKTTVENLKKYGDKAVDIQEKKDEIAKKLEQIENRLMSGYSRPLDDYRAELMAEDLKLSCQLTDILTK